MRWIFLAVLVMWIAYTAAITAKLSKAQLLHKLQGILRREKEMTDRNVAKEKRSRPVDQKFLYLVNITIGTFPESTSLLSDLSIQEIADVVREVTNNLLSTILKNTNCREFVITELFLGSLKHNLLMEYDSTNPESLHSVINAWSPTVMTDESKMDAIKTLFGPTIDQLNSLSQQIGVLDNEDIFFNALQDGLCQGVPHAQHGNGSPSNCAQTITFGDVLFHIFTRAAVLHVPDGANCVETVDVGQEMDKLSKNLKEKLSVMATTFGSDFLSQPDAESLRQFISENYASDMITAIADLNEITNTNNFDEFELEFAEYFIGLFFGRHIKTEEEHLEAATVVDEIRTTFNDIDLKKSANDLSSLDRFQVLSKTTSRLMELLAPNCPDVILTKLVLGFLNYMEQLRLLFNEDIDELVEAIGRDVTIPPAAMSSNRPHGASQPDSREDISVQGYSSIYDVLDSIPEIFTRRLQPGVEPIMILIGDSTAQWVFKEIENQLLKLDLENLPFHELMTQVLDSFLPFVDMEIKCPNADLTHLLQKAIQHAGNVGQITAEEVTDVYKTWTFDPNTQTRDNIPSILDSLRSETNALAQHDQHLQTLAATLASTDFTEIQTHVAAIIAAGLDNLITRVLEIDQKTRSIGGKLHSVFQKFMPTVNTRFPDSFSPVGVKSAYFNRLIRNAISRGEDVRDLKAAVRQALGM